VRQLFVVLCKGCGVCATIVNINSSTGRSDQRRIYQRRIGKGLGRNGNMESTLSVWRLAFTPRFL